MKKQGKNRRTSEQTKNERTGKRSRGQMNEGVHEWMIELEKKNRASEETNKLSFEPGARQFLESPEVFRAFFGLFYVAISSVS